MEFRLPFETKDNLFKELISHNNPFGLSQNINIVDFLSNILDLRNLPSEDSRFKNAYEDANQHLVNNSDWEIEYVFKERFRIIENDELFKKFLEAVVNNVEDNSQITFVFLINNYLKKFNYVLHQTYGMNGIVYNIIEIEFAFNTFEVPENDIVFYVTEKMEKLELKQYPCFVLNYDFWDDFNYKTRFDMYYFYDERKIQSVGKIKILKRSEYNTFYNLEKEFYKLNNQYCSLFTSDYSYYELKKIFGERYVSILAALNDAAYFPSIYESFENEKGFTYSLCRNEKEAEKILRTMRYKLIYGDISDLFNFNYNFKPLYSEYSVKFDFNFNGEKVIPKRVFSIIGKNGVGKTQFIKDLLVNLSQKNSDKILPHIPLYGKLLLISFSYFDGFERIRNNLDFNFSYCGLVNEEEKPITNEEMASRIIESIIKLKEKNVVNKYFLIIRKFIDESLIQEIIELPKGEYDLEFLSNNEVFSVRILYKKLPEVISKMSSGQLALFYIISEIVAKIRYNSLLIFDEPETHLHPNAITEFMSVIMELLHEFDSYGIIATHSPLVVRELFSDSIYVLEKDNDVPRVRQLEFESFGENLSTITSEIFGNRDVENYYTESIKKLVNSGKSYNEIEDALVGDVPLNLNVKILIKSLVKNRDEES